MQLKKSKALLLLPLIIMVGGCKLSNESSINSENVFAFNTGRLDKIPDSMLDNIRYTLLYTPEDIPLGSIDKAVDDDGIIYIGDYKSHKIFLFDHDGRMIKALDKRGRGPGEYVCIQSFSVDKQNIYIMDPAQKKIISYNKKTLSFLSSKNIPVPAWDFSTLENGGFILAFAPTSRMQMEKNLRYRVFVTDANMNITGRWYSYSSEDVDSFSIRDYLSTNSNYIVYGSENQSGYSLFNRKDGQLLEKNSFTFIDCPSEGANFSVPYMSKRYLAMSLCFKNGWKHALYDRDNNNLMIATIPLIGIIGNNENEFICNWQSKDIYDSMINNGCKRASEDIDKQIHNGLPFLVFFEVK